MAELKYCVVATDERLVESEYFDTKEEAQAWIDDNVDEEDLDGVEIVKLDPGEVLNADEPDEGNIY